MTDNSIFAANPNRSKHLIPRTRKQPSIFIKIISFLLFFPLGLASFGFGGYTLWNSLRLSSEGQVIRGEIINLRMHRPNSGAYYEITYRYTIDNTSYERFQDVEKNYYDTMQMGAPIAIRYLPSSPNISEVDGQSLWILPRWPQTIAMLALGFLMFVNSLFLLRSNWKPAPTIEDGEIVRGHISKAKGESARDGSYWLEIEYEYSNPHGVTTSSKDRIQRDDL